MSARTVLSFSRDLEFATETELAKRMGCSRYYWLRAALKELLDNSMDSIEEAGNAAPRVLVVTEANEIKVADNGPGMSPDVVERLCVRSERISTREAFAAPDRGSQGNSLPAIMSLAFGFGRETAGLTITSQGVEHTIRLRINRLHGRIDLERVTREVPIRPGTIVALDWPAEISLADVEVLIDQHAWLNPHAEFQLNEDQLWRATAAVTKWTPGLPIPPQWYTTERFAHRVLLEIRRDPKITVAQFLTSFKGLTSSSKRSEVAAEVDLSYQPLAALLDASGTALDLDQTQALLAAMQRASRPPKHAVLGAVGKDTFERWTANHAPPSFLLTPPSTV